MAIFNSYVSWDLQKNHWPFSENADELCFPLYFFFIFHRKPMLDGFEKIGGPGVPNNVWFDGRWTENLRPNGQTLISNTTMEEGSFVDDLAKKHMVVFHRYVGLSAGISSSLFEIGIQRTSSRVGKWTAKVARHNINLREKTWHRSSRTVPSGYLT